MARDKISMHPAGAGGGGGEEGWLNSCAACGPCTHQNASLVLQDGGAVVDHGDGHWHRYARHGQRHLLDTTSVSPAGTHSQQTHLHNYHPRPCKTS